MPSDFSEPSSFSAVARSSGTRRSVPLSTSSSRCNWPATETRCLIESIKQHYARLTATKSSHGKKSVWQSIFEEFQSLCEENNAVTTKTINQTKEKWRILLDRYKAVSDHNKQTGHDPKTFEFFEDIDEFMHDSDKVHPRFVQQTPVAKPSKKRHQRECMDI